LSLVAVFFIDLDHQIIPDEIDLPGTAVGVVLSPWTIGILRSVTGAALGAGGFLLIGLIAKLILKKEALGGGDVKFMGMIGAFLGAKGVLITTFSGALFGAIIGSIFLKIKKKDKNTPIPFGPFLVVGAYIALFWGEEIIKWYMNMGF